MRARLVLIGALPLLLLATPASAITAKEKQETCKVGADSQQLTGAKRKTFMAKCMSNKNDPRGPATQQAPASEYKPTYQ
jgi:hypothetical protein